MPRRTEEDHHYTALDVEKYLLDAIEVLRQNHLDPATNDATLAAIVSLLGTKQVFYEQIQPNAIQLLR